MFKQSSSRRASHALFLVAALLSQSFAAPTRGVVFAKAADPEMKMAPSAPANAEAKLPAAIPQPVPVQQQPNAPNATVITATLDDNVAAATKVAPGGTINYTAVIKNTGTAGTDDATSVNYSHILDSNTTLVPLSVHASPIAINNAYTTAIGNTLLEVSNSPTSPAPKVTAAGTLFDNDTIATAPDTIVLQSFTATSVSGGTVSVNANGSFTYLPAAGFTGTDTFTYTIRNSADATLQDTATVTITVNAPRVWYVDNSGANGDGRSTSPFNTLAGAAAVDGIGDIIYIFTGGGNYTGGITLLNNELVIGNGVALVVNTITLRAAGSRPTVVNAGGAGMTLAQNNTLTGFNFGASTGFSITGTSVGTLTVNNMLINNTTGGALDLTGVGTPTVSVVLDSTTSTGGTKNVNLVGLNGTITLASGALSAASGNAFDVSAGAATITYSGTITNTAAARLINIASMTGGSVTLSGALSGTSSSTGINLTSNTGATITLSGTITLSTAANAAFTATGGGTVNATKTDGTVSYVKVTNVGTGYTSAPSVTFTGGGGSGAAATAVVFNGKVVAVNITSAGSGYTSAPAISFGGPGSGASASSLLGGLSTITTTTGTALNVTSTTIGSGGLLFRSITAGTGASGPANAIILNATGASGGLSVTGDGAASNNGSGGTIQKTTGVGVSLTTTQNVHLGHINLLTSGDDGINGHDVTNFTLDRSNLTTNGNAVAENGLQFGEPSGSIVGLSGTAAITNTAISASAGNNVHIRNASSATLTSLVITGSSFNDLNDVTGANSFLFEVTDTATLTSATVTSCTFQNNSPQRGLEVQVHISGTITKFTVQGSAFIDNGIQASFTQDANSAGNTGNMDFNFLNNGTLASPMITCVLQAINVFSSSNTVGGFIKGRIEGNFIGNPAVAGSGSSGGGGIRILIQGKTTGTFNIDGNTIRQVGFTNGARGMDLQFLGPITGAQPITQSDLTITNNFVQTDAPGATFPLAAIFLGADNQGSPAQVRADIRSNTVPATGSFDYPTFSGSDPQLMFANVTAGAVAQLVDNPPASGTAAAELASHNTGLSGTSGTVTLIAGPITTPPAAIPNQVDDQAANTLPPLMHADVKQQPAPVAKAPEAPSTVKQVVPSVSETSTFATAAPSNRTKRNEVFSHHAARSSSHASDESPNAPLVTVSVAIGTLPALPAGKTVTIKYAVTVNTPPLVRQISAQGTVTFNGNPGGSVNTTDFSPPNGPNTVTLIDTLVTWNGVFSTDWNTATNWTQPAGGTQYAPGVSNPAINDVVIPNVGMQPNIPVGGGDIGIYSLSLANGRTLTIDTGRILTIGGSPGGDLTVDGIISGGELRLGSGTHVINNAGGTGSIVGGNQATVLSGSTVTLNNNLQMGSLTVNAGGSMTILNRTLSLARAGAALNIPGGATFTTTGSTVVLNGGVGQTIAGIAYNNLTINNSIGAHVTGVTLQGNASVAGVLALTSSDLDTVPFILTQPGTVASTGTSDVVGTVKRTGGPFAPAVALTFGNPNNRMTFSAAGTKPTDVTVDIARAVPAGYSGAVMRDYNINFTGGSGFTTALRLHYFLSELNGNSEAPPNFNFRHFISGAWKAIAPTSQVTGNAVDNWLENGTVSTTDLPTRFTFDELAPSAAGGLVSGRIVDNNGNPVEGAVVRLSGGQARKTITDAEGNYHFDNVGTGGFYTATPSRANFSFNPFNRSFTLVGNQTDAAFTGTMLGDTQNPTDTPEYFVRQQYVDILGREPDEAGFNYWSDHIIACGEDVDCTRAQRTGVASAFFIENEFKQSGAFIYNLYKDGLGRRPVYAEYSADRRNVVGGPTLEEQKQAFAEAFVARAEFANRYQNNTTAESFVDALLSNVQQASGVDLSGERDSLIGRYNTGASQAESRTVVLRDVTENAAVRDANYNKAFVLVEYFGYLHRGPDQQGYDFWLNVLNTGDPGNYRGMVCSFITSAEYQRRFSAVVSHSNGECGQ
jgi:hypothetical protein